MRIRYFFSVLVCLAVVCPVWGEAVSEGEARQIASRFFASHFKASASSGLRLAQRAPSVQAGAPAPYYVFNASADKGFVIVAGDDRAPQVLGYSDEGAFDYNDMPEALQAWLDGYAAQIAALDEGAAIATHITGSQPIAPLVRANWSQRAPYNILLPYRSNGEHFLVGCGATAVAQVMHYWQWPKRPTAAIPAYVTTTLEYNMPELPPVEFDWASMKDTYHTDDTVGAAAQAVATLSMYCAHALTMDFKESASSSYARDIPGAMARYFGYSPNAVYVHRRYFTTEDWETMILDELKARRPVLYSGSKLSSGHGFVCDGYDGNGMFHINWGWNSQSNGYFLLSVLNPDLQGAGSASGSHGYILSQAIVVGLQPKTTEAQELEVINKSIEIKDCLGTRTSVNKDFTVTQESQFLNCMVDSIGFNYAWGLYQGDELLRIMEPGVKENLKSWYYTRIERTLPFGSGISSGTYRIVPLFSELNTENWRPCPGGDVNYIEVIIDGNHCDFNCYGAAMSPEYQMNSISVNGNMHPNRPVDITLNVTNLGYTRNDLIYMFVEDKSVSVGYSDLPHSETGNVTFRYMPQSAGTVTLKFTLDEEGEQVLGTHVLSIYPMPSASLTGSARALNVTDASRRIITANEFGANVTVINQGTTTYDEDITFTIYKNTYSTRGTAVQSVTQHLTLEPNKTTTLTFHLDNVINGWNYFAYVYYYSAGEQVTLTNIRTHTIVFPEDVVAGDVNSDGVVNISDINVLINMILNGNNDLVGDVNGDGVVNIGDINATINIILSSN